jgi:CRISPR/Cas system-associated exonuclease Cas4 (RecB family)
MLDSTIIKNKLTFARIQSPSSINTYNQCPRKYYYHYIEKLPGSPSIHLTRGKIAHSVLENFFKVKVQKLPEANFMFVLKIFIHDMLEQYWQQQADELNKLQLTRPQLDFYFTETKGMVDNWYKRFLRKLATEMEQHNFVQAFDRLTPKAEEYYESKPFGIRGYIDAIHEVDGEVILMDYKTSKRPKMSPEYRLQLALYAMMYEEKHGSLPDRVGIDFLRHNEMHLDVDTELVSHAKCESELIHINTQSKDKQDYPMQPGPLCKWSTGQCDFFKQCFGNANSQYGS